MPASVSRNSRAGAALAVKDQAIAQVLAIVLDRKLLRLDSHELDHLGPFLGFIRYKLTELSW
jgi:hypothetical protein